MDSLPRIQLLGAMTPQKRIFDILIGLALSVIMVPAIVIVTLVLLIKQGRPVFYIAERMKTPTQSFGLVKFRTMTVVERDSGVSGADKEARVTPVGAKLRAVRLDEMPQLLNIFRGDISFVGPRPPLRAYVKRFPDIYTQVLESRPGVAGLATLYYHRSEARLLANCKTPQETDDVYCRRCIPRKASLDLLYQRHQSVCFDFILLLQTLQRLLKRR